METFLRSPRRSKPACFRSPHLSGYGNEEYVVVAGRTRFQKPAFEWVWKHTNTGISSMTELFQKPAFEWVWKLYELAGFSLAYVVSEACI